MSESTMKKKQSKINGIILKRHWHRMEWAPLTKMGQLEHEILVMVMINVMDYKTSNKNSSL
jgi:hypothetical protein